MKTILVNEKELKKKLSKVYEAFLKNPKDKIIHKRAINYDRKYGSIGEYNGEYGSPVIILSEKTKKAIGFLSFLCQYGVYDDDSELSKEKIFGKAKKILEDLKESEK